MPPRERPSTGIQPIQQAAVTGNQARRNPLPRSDASTGSRANRRPARRGRAATAIAAAGGASGRRCRIDRPPGDDGPTGSPAQPRQAAERARPGFSRRDPGPARGPPISAADQIGADVTRPDHAAGEQARWPGRAGRHGSQMQCHGGEAEIGDAGGQRARQRGRDTPARRRRRRRRQQNQPAGREPRCGQWPHRGGRRTAPRPGADGFPHSARHS